MHAWVDGWVGAWATCCAALGCIRIQISGCTRSLDSVNTTIIESTKLLRASRWVPVEAASRCWGFNLLVLLESIIISSQHFPPSNLAPTWFPRTNSRRSRRHFPQIS